MSAPSSLPPEAAATELVFQLALGYVTSSALHVALELGLPDRLAAGPRTVADLARDTGANEDALYRVLRVLASVGMFEEQAPRTFAANLPAQMLGTAPNSGRDFAYLMTHPSHFRVFAELLHSVRTGRPSVEQVMGKPWFKVLAEDPTLSAVFNDAMTSMSAQVIPAALEAFDFSDIRVLVDVSGGHGHVLTSILQRHPAMQGVLFDLDHVVAGAGPLIDRTGVADRCTTVAGDIFAAVPAGGDAYIMKHILHDWDDDRALVILGNIRQALGGRTRGRLLLLEAVVQAGNAPDLSKLIDIGMLVFLGGRERTAEEFRGLLDRAGFDLTRIVPTASAVSIIEAAVR